MLLPSATPGFDPWTFGSRAKSSNHRATAVARTEPPKPRVVLFPYVFSIVFSFVLPKCHTLHTVHIEGLVIALSYFTYLYYATREMVWRLWIFYLWSGSVTLPFLVC